MAPLQLRNLLLVVALVGVHLAFGQEPVARPVSQFMQARVVAKAINTPRRGWFPLGIHPLEEDRNHPYPSFCTAGAFASRRLPGGENRFLEFAKGSTPSDTAAPQGWRARHQPKRATLYSAVLPGAGQIYNRKYWKAPIVWAGLGTCIYFVQRNNRQYTRYRDAYVALVDNDPATTDEFNGAYSADAVRGVADTYRKWRDLSWIFTAGVYILNVVDANVDAHFVRFDVGNDLSLALGPSLPLASQGALGMSFSLQLGR
jgi:Family of unknown function (DUF5683)